MLITEPRKSFILRVEGAKRKLSLRLPEALDACYSDTFEIKAETEEEALEALAMKQAHDDQRARDAIEQERANDATPGALFVLNFALEHAPRYTDFIVK